MNTTIKSEIFILEFSSQLHLILIFIAYWMLSSFSNSGMSKKEPSIIASLILNQKGSLSNALNVISHSIPTVPIISIKCFNLTLKG